MGLIINEIYHIELQPRWGKSYDVKVVGICGYDSIKAIDSAVNLKKDFFDDYGIGISTYLLLLTNNTPVYICRPIISYDPFEIEENDSKRVFIPESIVSQVRTYTYTLAKRYIFEVSAGIKRYKNILAEDKYINDMRVKIGNELRGIEDLVADNISTDIKSVDVLVTGKYLDTLDKERQELLDKYKTLSIQKQNNYEDEQRSLYEQIVKTKHAETKYEELRQILIGQLDDIAEKASQNEEMNNILLRIKDIMREMIAKLKSGEMLPDEIPSFDNLYEEAEEELYG
jgi:hypothetical protein